MSLTYSVSVIPFILSAIFEGPLLLAASGKTVEGILLFRLTFYTCHIALVVGMA